MDVVRRGVGTVSAVPAFREAVGATSLSVDPLSAFVVGD
jgi:hypothetical protein